MRAAIAFFPGDQSLKLAQLISVLKGEEQPPEPEVIDDDEEQEQQEQKEYPPPPFVAMIQELLEEEKFVEVIQTYANESGLLLNVADRDLEAVYNLLIAMVKDVPVTTIPSLVKSISDPIVSAAPERAHLRLKILSNLYNSLEHTSPARHDVYLSIVDVASKSDELDTLIPTFASLDEWVVLWGIPLNKTRDLYRLLSDKLASTKAFKRQGYEFALKLLTTYESSDAKTLTSVSADAIRAIELAVKIPVVLNFEPLYKLGAVQALKGAKNGKDVFELLKIFVDGNLKSYKAFAEKKADFFKKHGLNNDDNTYKMRLLSLASLAANHVQGEVSYGVIAAELAIDEDDVEMWVIDGIRAGLIEAKMNQLKKTILVSRATQRIFRKEQWDALGQKLDAWKVHLDEMLQVIANAKLLAVQGIDDIPAQ